MARIQIGGAGGAPGNNVIRCLRRAGNDDYVIGQTSQAADLFLADVDEGHVVPPALADDHHDALLSLLERTRPDWLHVQHDFEVRSLSRMRAEVEALGVRLFIPAAETIEDCVDKHRSYLIWAEAGLPVPETVLVGSPSDLDEAFARLGPRVWLRATEGGGGTGAISTEAAPLAQAWIDRHEGWGRFTAARCLTPQSITWQSIWREGELIVAQTRARGAWAFSDRSPTGVTGVTHVGITRTDPQVDEIAEAAIHAIDSKPHGIFGVDLTYDHAGVPNLTEINIGRFFTTISFFAGAGLNMPAIARDIALGEPVPELDPTRNPLPDGLVWIRGMDTEPRLTTEDELRVVETGQQR